MGTTPTTGLQDNDQGITAAGEVVHVQGGTWVQSSINIKGPTGRTPEITSGATVPALNTGLEGDLFIHATGVGNPGNGDLYLRDAAGAWNKLTINIEGPMGPAITIKGHIDETDTVALHPPAAKAGDAYVLISATKPLGDPWLSTTVGTVLGSAIIGTPVEVGDIVFFDGTAWRDGCRIQGATGATGATGPALTVGTVTAVAGDAADATVTPVAGALNFAFTMPRALFFRGAFVDAGKNGGDADGTAAGLTDARPNTPYVVGDVVVFAGVTYMITETPVTTNPDGTP